MRVFFATLLQALLGLVIITVTWMIASAILQDANKLPSLAATLNRIVELATSDDYHRHVSASATVLLKGVVPAVAGAILLGIVAGTSTVFRWILGPLFITLAAAPLIALMSLLLLWFGLGTNLTILAVAIITAFPVANAVMMSLRTRQGRISLAIVRGLRWGAALGVSALVICEMLTARFGVGTYIMNAGSLFDAPGVAAGIVLVFVPTIAVVAFLQAIEERLAV